MEENEKKAPEREKQLVCRNASLGYEGQTVTEGLDFSVCRGDYLCILGENGSGKSTLVKAILGLRPQISGEIEWCGGVKANEIGYLPQQTVVQRDFPASVREIVRSGCLAKTGLRPFFNHEEKKLAESTMKQLGIDSLAKRCYRDLSGGQQQRVLLARALCATRKMLLLDEPVTGLDPRAQLDLYELITNLNKQGITIIMVSHDVAAAVRYASHILHIGSHRQLFFGTTAEYTASGVGQSFLAAEETYGASAPSEEKEAEADE
ncbi:MAG: metal ABC transporter ATP-binding protein [Ruminococcus sp.]|nr:metal ABC transporter ATP-binding protein [Ruminococcus sp.]